jgi:hypothetical protein
MFEATTYTKTWATVEVPRHWDDYGIERNLSGDYPLHTAHHLMNRLNGVKIIKTWERTYERGPIRKRKR